MPIKFNISCRNLLKNWNTVITDDTNNQTQAQSAYNPEECESDR